MLEFPAGAGRDGFEPSDFTDAKMSEQDRKKYHMHLEARWCRPCCIEVRSKSGRDVWYKVYHDYTQPDLCKCTFGTIHREEEHSHMLRVQAILDRRHKRLSQQPKSTGVDFAKLRQQRAEQKRREEAPLNGNRGFSLTGN